MSNLNIVLVSAGLAWWYERNAPEDETLKSVQHTAKTAKRGLWADDHPIAPWKWRKKGKGQ